jgi:hypothetical protein
MLGMHSSTSNSDQGHRLPRERCGGCAHFSPITGFAVVASHGHCALIHEDARNAIGQCRFVPSRFVLKESAHG